MNNYDDNDQPQSLQLICSRHGQQGIGMYCKNDMSVLLKCGCSYSMERCEISYQGNLFDGDLEYTFPNEDEVIADLIS